MALSSAAAMRLTEPIQIYTRNKLTSKSADFEFAEVRRHKYVPGQSGKAASANSTRMDNSGLVYNLAQRSAATLQ